MAWSSVTGYCAGHRLGLLPLPEDARDWGILELAGAPVRAVHSKVDMFQSFPKVRNQGDRGSCGPHSAWWCLGKLAADAGVDADLSPLFIYWVTRYLMSTLMTDGGVDNRQMAKALARFGASPEAMWPYGNRLFEKPSREAFRSAMSWQLKLGGYGWAATVDEARGVLDILGQPLIVAVPVYESFESDRTLSTGMIPMPDTGRERLLGYHDMACCGYDDGSRDGDLLLVNSWGAGVGEGGRFRLPYDYPVREFMVLKAAECGKDDPAVSVGAWELMWRKARGMA